MNLADRNEYLEDIVKQLKIQWPANRTINIVCHGHSFPAGYTETPIVDTFNAYPHLLHRGLKERFPYAVINVIVTAIGGENSIGGSERFERNVLCHHPDIVIIDYSLNDRGLDIEKAYECWSAMIEMALKQEVKLILVSPPIDALVLNDTSGTNFALIKKHAIQVRQLAEKYEVGFADVFTAYKNYIDDYGELMDLYNPNHPNRKGHEMIALELMRWFYINN